MNVDYRKLENIENINVSVYSRIVCQGKIYVVFILHV